MVPTEDDLHKKSISSSDLTMLEGGPELFSRIAAAGCDGDVRSKIRSLLAIQDGSRSRADVTVYADYMVSFLEHMHEATDIDTSIKLVQTIFAQPLSWIEANYNATQDMVACEPDRELAAARSLVRLATLSKLSSITDSELQEKLLAFGRSEGSVDYQRAKVSFLLASLNRPEGSFVDEINDMEVLSSIEGGITRELNQATRKIITLGELSQLEEYNFYKAVHWISQQDPQGELCPVLERVINREAACSMYRELNAMARSAQSAQACLAGFESLLSLNVEPVQFGPSQPC